MGYHRLAVKLYKFLARRTNAKVNSLILKRLMNSRVCRAPISIARLAKFAQRKSYQQSNKAGAEPIFAIVGTVTDDIRQFDFPKVNICALRFTESARARITSNGGFCTTFDQLALNRPNGENVILLKDPEQEKHFSISDVHQVSQDQLLNHTSELREENSKKLEEEEPAEDMPLKENKERNIFLYKKYFR